MLTTELSSYLLGKPNDALQHSVDSDWLFNTH